MWAEEKERMTREAEQLTALRDQDKVKVQQLEVSPHSETGREREGWRERERGREREGER